MARFYRLRLSRIPLDTGNENAEVNNIVSSIHDESTDFMGRT